MVGISLFDWKKRAEWR